MLVPTGETALTDEHRFRCSPVSRSPGLSSAPPRVCDLPPRVYGSGWLLYPESQRGAPFQAGATL